MEIVYNGFDNEVRVKVSEAVNGVIAPFDFSGATSLELYIPDLDQTITSGIDWSHGGGVVSFELGQQNIPIGNHRLRLTVFDPLHPNGQILLHELIHDFRLRVI
jgi:hypothetical protein